MKDEKKKPRIPTFWLYAITLVMSVLAIGGTLMVYFSRRLEFSPMIALGVAVVLLVLAFELSRNWEHYSGIRGSSFRSREWEIQRKESELAAREEELERRAAASGREEQSDQDRRRQFVAEILFWWRRWGRNLVDDSSSWDSQRVAAFLREDDPERPGRPRFLEYLEPARVVAIHREAASASTPLGTSDRRRRLARFAGEEARDLVQEHLGRVAGESELEEIFRRYHERDLYFVEQAKEQRGEGDGVSALSQDKQQIFEGFQNRMQSLIQESKDDGVLKARLRSVAHAAIGTAHEHGQHDLAERIEHEMEDVVSRVERGEHFLP